jgi:hypothetical protein
MIKYPHPYTFWFGILPLMTLLLSPLFLLNALFPQRRTLTMSTTNWLLLALALFLFIAVTTAFGGCSTLRSTNEFGSGEHQSDPLLDAAATAWQAKQH